MMLVKKILLLKELFLLIFDPCTPTSNIESSTKAGIVDGIFHSTFYLPRMPADIEWDEKAKEGLFLKSE